MMHMPQLKNRLLLPNEITGTYKAVSAEQSVHVPELHIMLEV